MDTRILSCEPTKTYGIDAHAHYLNKHIAFHHVYYLKTLQIPIKGNDKMNEISADPCDSKYWRNDMKFNQDAIIGCGSLDSSVIPPTHEGLSNYDLWNYFAVNGTDKIFFPTTHWILSDSGRDPVPILRPLLGYNLTKHYKKYGQRLKQGLWKEFGPNDCENIQLQNVPKNY